MRNRVDIVFYVGKRTPAEFRALIDRAERTIVPRAVPGKAQQEAGGFAGGANGTLLKK
jgi:hypothetical protein